jgi:mRNA-degrading endonuclease toxin of MazEF toxin-antitoxin module
MYVVVLSNASHIEADTGRVIVCPFIPGQRTPDGVRMMVGVERPTGHLLPELVHWLPVSALDDPIGFAEPTALLEAALIVNSLIW